jgi:hypothetical protein
MIQSNFSFSRFLHTLRYCWQTQVRSPYITMLGLMPVFYLFLSAFNEYIPWLCFSFMFYICGWLYAGLSFSELANPIEGRQFLALPASPFEKWLAKWVLSAIIFPMIMVCFSVVALQLFNLFAAPLMTVRYTTWSGSPVSYKLTFFFFFLLQPLWFAAGLFWKRYSLLKFVGFLVGLIVLYVFWRVVFPTVMLTDNGSFVRYELINLPFGEPQPNAQLATYQAIYWVMGFYVPSLLFLVASFYLFKQKEI